MQSRTKGISIAAMTLVMALGLMSPLAYAVGGVQLPNQPQIFLPGISNPKAIPSTDFNPAGNPLQLSFDYANLDSDPKSLFNAGIYHMNGANLETLDHTWVFTKSGTGTANLTWDGTVDATSKKATDGSYYFKVLGHQEKTNTNFTAIIAPFTVKNAALQFGDLIAPKLTEKTKVPTPAPILNPSYTFTSDEAGTIIYGGDCKSPTKNAIKGDNKVTFDAMALGAHTNCTIQVQDTSINKNTSLSLHVSDFTINKIDLNFGDKTAPQLTEVTKVPTPTVNTTPSYTFNTNEAGAIIYTGDCLSSQQNAAQGNNTITFYVLSLGNHSNCAIQVKDSSDNLSSALNINDFTIISGSGNPVPVPGTNCAGFTDISSNDANCNIYSWVKNEGIFTGNADGTFNANGLLQRDQIAKVVLEAFGKYKTGTEYCLDGNPFPDVAAGSWSREYICLGKKTLVNGVFLLTGYKSGPNAGLFLPANAVNRSEFLAMVLRNLNQTMPSANTSSYSDVELGQWDSGYAAYAAQHLTSIYPQPVLSRTSYVTRLEAAKVLYALHNQGSL